MLRYYLPIKLQSSILLLLKMILNAIKIRSKLDYKSRAYFSVREEKISCGRTCVFALNAAVDQHQMFRDNELSKDQLSPETADAVPPPRLPECRSFAPCPA